MLKFVVLTSILLLHTPSPLYAQKIHTIIDRPIAYGPQRIQLTLDYIKQHYGIATTSAKISPKAIVIHWTATQSLRATWKAFNRVRLRTARRHLLRGGALNVSAHFLISRSGKIYQLIDEKMMARHCIGLNYDSIGIENMGGGRKRPLTKAQLKANAYLVRHLVKKYKIRYLLGHFEWKKFEHAPFFRELDPTYRNAKGDPGKPFMRSLRHLLLDLKLKAQYDAH